MTSLVRTVASAAVNTVRHTFYIAAPVAAKYFMDNIQLVSRNEGLSQAERGALENLELVKYVPAVVYGGSFVAGLTKVSKITEPEILAQERAKHFAEYAVYAGEIGASVVALSYGLDPKTFLPMFMALDLLSSGENSLVDNFEDGLATFICNSGLVGDCGDFDFFAN
ncbi:MAG: hypothetical protein K0T99_03510 [Alphaproteobacteria bacterium]|nr:hypothetical protein [Alphaproteobacteria bacterium]